MNCCRPWIADARDTLCATAVREALEIGTDLGSSKSLNAPRPTHTCSVQKGMVAARWTVGKCEVET